MLTAILCKMPRANISYGSCRGGNAAGSGNAAGDGAVKDGARQAATAPLPRSTVDIHSAFAFFSVALHHAIKLPAVPFMETRVIGDQVNGRYARFAQFLHRRMQQVPCDAPTAIGFFRVDRADVRRQVLAVVKIVFDHAESADDRAVGKAEIPPERVFPSR